LGARKQRVSTSKIDIWALANHGPITAGNLMTIWLERVSFNSSEDGYADAITESINLIAARVLYKKK